MDLRKEILIRYRSSREDFLENEGAVRQRWFDDLCENNYKTFLRRDMSILEIGCGYGYILKWLKENGFSLLEGVDISNENIEVCRKYTGLESVFKADALVYLKGKENKYDLILSKATIEHLTKEEIGELIVLVRSSLRVGGKFIIQVPNMDWLLASHERYMDLTHETGFTRESLANLLRLCFDDVEVRPVKSESPRSLVPRFKFGVLRPILIKFIRLIFNILGESGSETWFFSREIIASGTKH